MGSRRCIFGCSTSTTHTLFSFPKIPWLRARWLEFLHFEEGGITQSSRLCARHFTVDSFRNYMQARMGFISPSELRLEENAIPTVYTVGASSESTHLRPTTQDVGCQHTPCMKTTASQVSFPAPRAKRRSKGVQVKPAGHSVAVGCSMVSVGEPILMSTPSKRPRVVLNSSQESSSSESYCTVEPQDSTYVPDVSQEEHEDQKSACLPLYNTAKYIVYHDKLMELFRTCPTCSRTCQINTFVVGTLISITQVCSHCHHKLQWNSQPYIGNTPAGNLQLSAAVAFNGASYVQIHKVLSSLRVECICPRTFYNHQQAFLQPAILWQWRVEQQQVIERAKQSGEPITLGGDMRADSPGHCAKFGSYSMLNLDDNRIIDLQLVQSNEVGNSGRMELHGFMKSLKFLKEAGVKVGAMVTDRHPSVQKYMREKQEDIVHYYDTWHVSKGLTKKIDALGKQKNCGEVLPWKRSTLNHVYWCASSSKSGEEVVDKWKSITNHVQNVHHHDSELFPDCAHQPLDERAWLRPNTKACEMFCDLMLKKRLLKDMAKLSPHHQTSSIESFHALILKFAPKNVSFPFMGMLCRLLLAALHYNENADRDVLCNADGEPVVRVKWPKYKKGDYSLCYVKTSPTYNYVDTLQRLVLEEVVFSPGPYQQLRDQVEVPENLCAAFERPNIQEAMASKWSRYRQEL